MFFLEVLPLLAGQVLQVLTEAAARVARLDDVVHKASDRRRERVAELGRVLCLACCGVRVAAVQDRDGPLGAHHGDLGCRPRVVGVASQVFGGHDVIGAAVRLPRGGGRVRHTA